jgi:hypothetical protein
MSCWRGVNGGGLSRSSDAAVSSSTTCLSCSTALSALPIGQALAVGSARPTDLSGRIVGVARSDGAAIGVYQDIHQREHKDATAYRDTRIQPNPEWSGH